MNPHTSSLFLPPELKKILYEVARTGKCNSLPWTASDIRSSFKGPSSSSSSCSKKKKMKAIMMMMMMENNSQREEGSLDITKNQNFENKSRHNGQPFQEDESGGVHAATTKLVMSSGLGSSLLHSHNHLNVDDNSSVKSCASKVSNAYGDDDDYEDEQEESEKEYEEDSVHGATDHERRRRIRRRRRHNSSSGATEIDGSGSIVGTNMEDAGSLTSHESKRSHDDAFSPGGGGGGGVVGLHAKSSGSVSGGIEKTGTAASGIIGLERKRARRGLYYRDHQSCASSCCSESVSSTGGGSTISVPSSMASMGPLGISLPFRTLRGALRLAVALVLEYSYKNRGGYKLSPAEKRKYQMFQKQQNHHHSQQQHHYLQYQHQPTSFMDIAFTERRIRLLKMLGGGKSARSTSSVTRVMSGSASDGGFTSDTSFESGVMRKNSGGGGKDFVTAAPASSSRINNDSGPPFTIQRVAEVLLMPERYYGQTHKLCNALEKLLLVTSPSTAFGGIMGGDSLPSSYRRGDEREMIVERKEQNVSSSEYMHTNMQLQRRISVSSCSSSSSCTDNLDPIIQMNVSVETCESAATSKKIPSNTINTDGVTIENEHEIHVDSNSQIISCDLSKTDRISQYNDNRALKSDECSSRQDSVPRSSSLILGHAPGPLQGNTSSLSPAWGLSGNNRPPSPSLYSPHNSFMRNTQKATVMPGQHRRTIAGDPNSNPLLSRQNVQMEILIDPTTTNANLAHSAVQNSINAADVSFLDNISGRSSASNSDIDSESDDISFDDSASDRSDGSDFDTGALAGLPEPITAARVMALNRMQQQHRREQYLQDRALRQQVAIFQPPPDSEYQSGDSIDSGLAEDSCGSDSSSSDFTD